MTFQPTWNYADFAQVAAAVASEIVVKRELRHELFETWGCSLTDYPGEEVVLASMKSAHSTIRVINFGDRGIAKLIIENGSVHATVYGKSLPATEEILGAVKELMPAIEVRSGLIPVTFWYWSALGPTNNVRMIPVPAWKEIESNYPSKTRNQVAELMENRIDIDGGQLVLWQGQPGTGKTFALRSLMDSWRDWADFHFIVDPDAFFGEHTDYMMQVLLHAENDHAQPWMHRGAPSPRSHKEEDDRWKILVLEDSGELLAQDARERVGQGLSRLLNVVDGIIGQGLRVIILVTTNEELKSLHPAIQRPGRCASRIPFGEFTVDEAREWLASHNSDPELATKQTNISWLYAAMHGLTTEEELAIGFNRKLVEAGA